jgi:hypothetical protein
MNVIQPPPDSSQPPGHEMTDVSPWAIAFSTVCLGLMVTGVMVFLSWLFWRFEADAKQRDVAQSSTSVESTYTGPLLQPQPSVELARFRRSEERRLSSYGWIDRKQRVIRIPITRAIEILAERDLPETTGSLDPNRQQEPNE